MNNRVVYVDLLKVFAAFSVVLLHTAAENWGNVTIGTFEWNVINFYDSLVRFGVPIFVMTSGMFLLNTNKDISYKDIFLKYILRIFIAFVSWSMLYAIYTNIADNNNFNNQAFFRSFIFGHYHLWYLYMIIGLYIITPLLRKIVTDKKATEYFLVLSLITTFIFPIIIKSFNITDFDIFLKKFDVSFALGYAGYYVGGYYFSKYELKKHERSIIYIIGVLGVICTYVFTDILSLKMGTANSTFYSYFAPNVLVVSLAIFVFFKYEISKIKFNQNSEKLIGILSGYSFRIYLVHDFFNIFIKKIGINTLDYNPAISIMFVAIIVFSCSLITSFLIGKIPLLKRIL